MASFMQSPRCEAAAPCLPASDAVGQFRAAVERLKLATQLEKDADCAWQNAQQDFGYRDARSIRAREQSDLCRIELRNAWAHILSIAQSAAPAPIGPGVEPVSCVLTDAVEFISQHSLAQSRNYCGLRTRLRSAALCARLRKAIYRFGGQS